MLVRRACHVIDHTLVELSPTLDGIQVGQIIVYRDFCDFLCEAHGSKLHNSGLKGNGSDCSNKNPLFRGNSAENRTKLLDDRKRAVSRLAFWQEYHLIINGRHGKVKSNRGHVDDL